MGYQYDREELLALAAQLAWKYNGGESTSVTYEKAQTFMEAVLYCLEAYNRSRTGLPARRDISVEEQYKAGTAILYAKVEAVREMYNELSPVLEDYGVRCLSDTLRKGIPLFLQWYDIRFCPQDMVVSLEYPLLSVPGPARGAEAVEQYMRSIRMEQQFLGMFDKRYIRAVLEGYDDDYRNMTENICGMVLTDLVGHIALDKPLRDGGFREQEYRRLSDVFGGKPAAVTTALVKEWTGRVAARLCGNDGALAAYLGGCAEELAARIELAMRCGKPETIFIPAGA